MARAPAGPRSGVRIETFDTLGSTNEEALARARKGERGPLWITARRQTAGRGRRARPWVSEPGNLYASLLLNDPCPPERAAELSFVAALALHDAIVEAAPALGPRATLKWPNDMLIDGAKVAGILVEGESAGSVLAAVVGIGVNCAVHPDDTPYPATNLGAAGAAVSADDLMRTLARTMTARLAQWDRGGGFASVRADWLKRAGGIGCDLRIVIGEREIVGRFETLDDAGRLVLRLPSGSAELVAAGDVFPVARASAPVSV
jgi:BirA family biotin operon repressor/biotin-[acetyl-CoA-carboxylase] ligase